MAVMTLDNGQSHAEMCQWMCLCVAECASLWQLHSINAFASGCANGFSIHICLCKWAIAMSSVHSGQMCWGSRLFEVIL